MSRRNSRLIVRVTRLRRALRKMVTKREGQGKAMEPDEPEVRVAIFTDTFDEINGVANTYRRLREYALRYDRRLDIYCFAESDGVEKQGNCTVTRFKRILSVPYYEKLSFELAPHFPLLQALHGTECDIVHVTAPDTLGSHATAMAKLRRIPLVGVYHTSLPEYAAQYIKVPQISKFVQQVSWQIVKTFYEQCDLVLATTPGMADRLKKDGMHATIKVMMRGVDAELFHPGKRRKPVRDEEPPVILYTGRIATEKNLEWYAQILNQLRTEGLAFKAKFIGDGPYREELQTLLPWAEFPGYKQGEELAEAYADADIFAFPSLTDTFGNVVLEAMASGLPCVVADVVGPGEIVENGKTGYLAPGDGEFAEKLAYLVASPTVRHRMAEEARLHAEKRSWDSIFDKLWERYEGLACRKPKE